MQETRKGHIVNDLGSRIAKQRKDLGMTQIEFAERMHVTRQTVSRWESGAAMPDIEKLGDIATILGVDCDYLLRGVTSRRSEAGRLLNSAKGRKVRLTFFEDEADIDLFNVPCRIVEFEGNWMKVVADTKKGSVEKLIPVSSVLSIEFVEEAQ